MNAGKEPYFCDLISKDDLTRVAGTYMYIDGEGEGRARQTLTLSFFGVLLLKLYFSQIFWKIWITVYYILKKWML